MKINSPEQITKVREFIDELSDDERKRLAAFFAGQLEQIAQATEPLSEAPSELLQPPAQFGEPFVFKGVVTWPPLS